MLRKLIPNGRSLQYEIIREGNVLYFTVLCSFTVRTVAPVCSTIVCYDISRYSPPLLSPQVFHYYFQSSLYSPLFPHHNSLLSSLLVSSPPLPFSCPPLPSPLLGGAKIRSSPTLDSKDLGVCPEGERMQQNCTELA